MHDSNNQKSQSDKFRDGARAAETDDDEGRFNERLKKLTKQKPGKGRPKD